MFFLSVNEKKFIQKLLGVKQDGVMGKITLSKMRNVTRAKTNDEEMTIRYIQKVINCKMGKRVIKVDGIFGPKTDAFLANLVERKKRSNVKSRQPGKSGRYVVRPEKYDTLGVNPPQRDTPSMTKFYGQAGPSQLVRMIFPYAMYYGGKRVKTTRVHKKARESFEYLFEETLELYGVTGIEKNNLDVYGGAYNFRRMRGGRAYSTHSWGAAIDMDPGNNRLRQPRLTARMATNVYQGWFNIAYEAGFISLGIEENRDWMHLQLTQA